MFISHETAVSLIANYGYYILLPLFIIEGSTVNMLAGFLASIGLINIFAIYFLAVLGDLIGDTLYYLVGRFGRKNIIPRFGKYIGIDENKIKLAQSHFNIHLFRTLLFGKLTQVPVVPILVVAGISEIHFVRFILTSLTIVLPKVLIYTLIGYYLGKSYVVIDQYLNNYYLTSGVTIFMALVIFLVYKKFISKKSIDIQR